MGSESGEEGAIEESPPKKRPPPRKEKEKAPARKSPTQRPTQRPPPPQRAPPPMQRSPPGGANRPPPPWEDRRLGAECRAILRDLARDGRLRENDIDEGALTKLAQLADEPAARVGRHLAAQPRAKVRNVSAWIARGCASESRSGPPMEGYPMPPPPNPRPGYGGAPPMHHVPPPARPPAPPSGADDPEGDPEVFAFFGRLGGRLARRDVAPDALDKVRPLGAKDASKVGDDLRRALRSGLPFDDVSPWLIDRCRPRDILGEAFAPLQRDYGLGLNDVDPRVRRKLREAPEGSVVRVVEDLRRIMRTNRIQNPSQWLSGALDRYAAAAAKKDKPAPKKRERSRSRSKDRDRPKRRHSEKKKEEKKPKEPPSFKKCGPKLATAFEPLEQTYNLDREELEDDVKEGLLKLKDEKAASCVLALFATLQRQQLESPIDWLKERIAKAAKE